jgi:uncharacterized membrane protein YkoI
MMVNRRMIALAAMTVLLAGTLGFSSYRTLAQGVQPTATPPVQAEGVQEIQSGNQVEDGLPDSSSEIAGVEASETASEAGAFNEAPGTSEAGPDVQDPTYAASVAISPDLNSGLSEADEAAALRAQATVSATEAESAALSANPGASVVKTELDNENGALVYSVELSNGADVKVDAGNGAILHTDAGGNNEG